MPPGSSTEADNNDSKSVQAAGGNPSIICKGIENSILQ